MTWSAVNLTTTSLSLSFLYIHTPLSWTLSSYFSHTQQHAIHPAPFLPCSTPWLGEHSFKRHHLPCIRSTDRRSACVGEEPPSSPSLPCLSLHFHGRGPWSSSPATPLRDGAPPRVPASACGRYRGQPTRRPDGQPRSSLPCHATRMVLLCRRKPRPCALLRCTPLSPDSGEQMPPPSGRHHRRHVRFGRRFPCCSRRALPTCMHLASVNPVIACDKASKPRNHSPHAEKTRPCGSSRLARAWLWPHRIPPPRSTVAEPHVALGVASFWTIKICHITLNLRFIIYSIFFCGVINLFWSVPVFVSSIIMLSTC